MISGIWGKALQVIADQGMWRLGGLGVIWSLVLEDSTLFLVINYNHGIKLRSSIV